jgi:hypothetical protein
VRLWRLSYQTSSSGIRLEWFTTRRLAETALRQHEQADRDWHAKLAAWQADDMRGDEPTGEPGSSYEVEVVIVPTSQAALARWLNAHYNSDNG